MPEILTPARDDGSGPADVASTMTAVRLVAVAVTALLVSFMVVSGTRSAIEAGAATPASELATGEVSLSDDDGGASLFDLDGLLPGRDVGNCLTVVYDGTAFDGTVLLRVRGGGPLAAQLDVLIESGEGGGFGRCAGFRPDGIVFAGTLAELVERHGPDGEGLPGMTVTSAHVERNFRVTVTLRPDAAPEPRTATLELLWSVTV